MRFTIEEMYDILKDCCGVSEEFISGAIAVGGFTKKTMNDVAYYKSGYQTVEDWVNEITDKYLKEIEEEEQKMNKTMRENLMFTLIKKRGHEDRKVIQFCNLCELEELSDKTIKNIFDRLIKEQGQPYSFFWLTTL